jgi:hypothetical protein
MGGPSSKPVVLHARIDFLDPLPAEAHAVDRAGCEVLHHHIAGLDQLLEDLLAGRGLGVERDAALVAVQHGEVEAIHVGDIAQLTPGRIAHPRPLDLEHVGAEPRQELRTGRPRLHMSHVQHPDSFKRLAHFCPLNTMVCFIEPNPSSS